MTPGERIARLEGLLERVRRNTSRPRPARTAVPSKAAPAPLPASIPSPAAAPVPVPVPAPVAASAPVAHTPPAPPVASAPAPVASSSPEPAPFPPAPSPAPPVVAAAPPPSTSSVPPWKPEPGSTVQARPSTIPPEELSEDDLIEVTTVPPPAAPQAPEPLAAETSVPGTDEVEEPPASSRRSKVVAESLDQAIANAAADVDEHEVPIHTPPPESGPQEAVLPVGIDAPRAPEFGDLARPASLGPTPEQLGETIDLDEAEGPSIELDARGQETPEPPRERPLEELEVTLPRAEMQSGTYDVEAIAPPPIPPVAAPAPSAHHTPDVTARPAVAGADVTRVVRASEKAPETFAELLEQSLGL